MSMDSSVYYVMKHYSLSLFDIKTLTQEEFGQMLIWAVASNEIEREDIEKKQGQSSPKMKIGSTNMGGPMPHSEGW